MAMTLCWAMAVLSAAVKVRVGNLGITYKVVTGQNTSDQSFIRRLPLGNERKGILVTNTTPMGASPNIDECLPISLWGHH